MPIVVRGSRLLTIRTRLGRGTRFLSFSPHPAVRFNPPPSSFSPFPRRKRLSLNYERDTVKFCGADKGAIQIKRSPFPPLPHPRPFTYGTSCSTRSRPPSSLLSLPLFFSHDVFHQPLSFLSSISLRCRFQKRFPFPRPNRPPPNFPLAYLRCPSYVARTRI